MNHEDAAIFALLATLIVAAVALLEVPRLFTDARAMLLHALVGGVLAGVAVYLSVRFLLLMCYFATGRLDPFGYSCLAVDIGSLMLIMH